MPIAPGGRCTWRTWLLDGMAGKETTLADVIRSALETRRMPSVSISSGTMDVWNRSGTLYIDVISQLDGRVATTIHLLVYGISVSLARVSEAPDHTNYYNALATEAFVTTIDQSLDRIVTTLLRKPSAEGSGPEE